MPSSEALKRFFDHKNKHLQEPTYSPEISYLKLPRTCIHFRGFILPPMRGDHWRKLTNDGEGSSRYRYYSMMQSWALRR
jgi:hypothetical protein